MTNIAAGILYLIRDVLFAAALTLASRRVFLLPGKKRPVLFAALGLLLAGNAAVFVCFFDRSPENVRALADVASLVLAILLALSALAYPKSGAGTVILSALVMDFTVDVLYSLISSFVNDAPVAEAAFGVLLYGACAAGLLLAEKRGALSVLPGAFRRIPKPLIAVLLFFEFTCYYREFGEASSWYRTFYRISVVAVIGCLFWMVYRVLSFSRETSLLLQQLSAQKEQSDAVRRGDEALREFRHDYKNHMIVVSAYLEQGNTAAAKAYLNAMQSGVGAAAPRISCGNFAADAILNYKLAYAEERGVGLRFSGAVPPDGVRDEDLCAVLSNLLDNAVQACEKLPGDREINVACAEKNGFFLLSVSNPAPLPVDTGKTSKPDRKNHGLGLKNVRRVVKNYNGHLSFEQTGGVFTVNVRMERK